MIVTGPYQISANVPITLTQPASFQVAVLIQNISPYELTIDISNKQFALAPLTEDVFAMPGNVQQIVINPIQLSGSIPSGSNSDIVAVWYDANDDIQGLALSHPIPISANAVATGSAVTGDVDIVSPLGANGAVNVNVLANGVATASGANLTQVSPSTASVEVLAANASRVGFVIANGDTDTAYISFGATSSLTAYTFSLAPGAAYESGSIVYTGEITAIWATAGTGSLMVTELT